MTKALVPVTLLRPLQEFKFIFGTGQSSHTRKVKTNLMVAMQLLTSIVGFYLVFLKFFSFGEPQSLKYSSGRKALEKCRGNIVSYHEMNVLSRFPM